MHYPNKTPGQNDHASPVFQYVTYKNFTIYQTILQILSLTVPEDGLSLF